MKTPIDMMFDGIVWKPIEGGPQPASFGPPVATHEGVLALGEHSLRVYQLSDGRRVIDAEDMARLFGVSTEELGSLLASRGFGSAGVDFRREP